MHRLQISLVSMAQASTREHQRPISSIQTFLFRRHWYLRWLQLNIATEYQHKSEINRFSSVCCLWILGTQIASRYKSVTLINSFAQPACYRTAFASKKSLSAFSCKDLEGENNLGTSETGSLLGAAGKTRSWCSCYDTSFLNTYCSRALVSPTSS